MSCGNIKMINKKGTIVLSKIGKEFYKRFYLGGNIEVMSKWLPKINEEFKRDIDIWEAVVSVVGSSHLNLFKIKGGEKLGIHNRF